MARRSDSDDGLSDHRCGDRCRRCDHVDTARETAWLRRLLRAGEADRLAARYWAGGVDETHASCDGERRARVSSRALPEREIRQRVEGLRDGAARTARETKNDRPCRTEYA